MGNGAGNEGDSPPPPGLLLGRHLALPPLGPAVSPTQVPTWTLSEPLLIKPEAQLYTPGLVESTHIPLFSGPSSLASLFLSHHIPLRLKEACKVALAAGVKMELVPRHTS